MDDEVARHLQELRQAEIDTRLEREQAMSRAVHLVRDFAETMRRFQVPPIAIYRPHQTVVQEGKHREFFATRTHIEKFTYEQVGEGWPVNQPQYDSYGPGHCLHPPVVTPNSEYIDCNWSWITPGSKTSEIIAPNHRTRISGKSRIPFTRIDHPEPGMVQASDRIWLLSIGEGEMKNDMAKASRQLEPYDMARAIRHYVENK